MVDVLFIVPPIGSVHRIRENQESEKKIETILPGAGPVGGRTERERGNIINYSNNNQIVRKRKEEKQKHVIEAVQCCVARAREKERV